MLSSSFAIALLAASAAVAHPIARNNNGPTDTDILQYALTLEHLESTFYQEALGKFDDKDFTDAGLPDFARKRFVQISEHEKTHVTFLSTALGDIATKPCTYKFPYTDPKSFAALSMLLEGVGTSAYLGAARFIDNKDYLTAAASVLATEARHAGWVSSAVLGGDPWSGPLDTPLDLDQVFSLAAAFIDECPDSNPKLPVKAFPGLTFSPDSPHPGNSVQLSYNSSGKKEFFAVFTGLSTIFIEISDDKKVTIPSDAVGTVYGVVTTSNEKVSDDNTVAGPVIMVFPDDI
ncbi:hypothetical protein FRC04_010932 [Tulasnella sp. 424]|nr:hypothetical protein FRC04_010932 [Tulasnella sp. 424]KAG8975706.1 hypothetical protein FRC05_005224 [Tulasnella sp. 425]